MGVGAMRTCDLDRLVAECDRLGGPGSGPGREYLSDLKLELKTKVDVSLDPLSEEYFAQQAAVYTEISGRAIDQQNGELLPINVEHHAAGANPYHNRNISLIARHARAVQSCLLLADLPNGASVLDLGCGWGLTSELMAFAGASVTAVDINPMFADLVAKRAARLGLPIRAVRAGFDDFVDDGLYDMVFFYECLHHSLRPAEALKRAAERVKPGGKIVFAGEPINEIWWPHWGIRLDGESVFCIRKFGWWESGWTAAFLGRCFDSIGYALTMVHGVGLAGGDVGFAVRKEEAARVRPNFAAVGSAPAPVPSPPAPALSPPWFSVPSPLWRAAQLPIRAARKLRRMLRAG
jgi:2-polyprenyl-3-methyl-5-hydroxy-6-metoxy-1,4-benzoquinol methylase